MITLRTNKKIVYRLSERGGWEYTDDGGVNWYLTQRTTDEIKALCDFEPSDNEPDLEIYGETLDEEIPEEFHGLIL